jgi:uncharacterized protein (TIGR02145 family)
VRTSTVFLALTVAASICSSQSINISGSVTDSSGKGISGATVLLEKAKIATETDKNGFFSLVGAAGIIPQMNSPEKTIACGLFIENAQLYFTLAAPSVVEVAVYTIQGRRLSMINKSAGAGPHVWALPVYGAGIYFCRAKIGTAEYLLKATCLRQPSGGIPSRSTEKVQGTLAKRARAAATFDDVLSVIKDGFLDYRTVVYEPAMEMASIRMIANAGNLTDIDGNVYQTVRIGNQVWTVENLRVTKYNDGSAIPLETSGVNWYLVTTPQYCFYRYTTDSNTIKKYGALYNWHVVSPVNPKKIAPAGWHVPSEAEWDTLQNYLIAKGYNWDGANTGNKIAKSLAAKTDWSTTSTAGTIGCVLTKNNTSGFSALPGGYRGDIDFSYQGYFGCWWSASVDGSSFPCDRSIYSEGDSFNKGIDGEYVGKSVRLLRD